MCNKNHNHMRYSFWDRLRQIDFFVHLGHFLLFYPPNNPVNQNLEKIKNACDTTILYMCTKTPDHMVFTSWDMGATHNFLSFWVIFCPFTPLLAPKIKNWKKIRRYFLFHMCTINKDSWDIRHNRQKFLSFWAIFYPFIPLTNQKSKSKKNEKKALEIFLFYIFLPRMTIIWCTVPEIWSYTGKIFSHFGPFFALLLKNQSFEEKSVEISSTYTCVPQMTIIWCMVP